MDTIFAPISTLGCSIVSVRFSGENAFDILNAFGIDEKIYKNNNMFFSQLKYKERIIDEVVVKVFHAPNSFTGENIVEFDLHANRLILQDLLKIASDVKGFRFAKNGEFSKRAFLNGKMDILKSEGINAIIRAETRHQQLLANELFYGNIYKRYKDIRTNLIEAISYTETAIDFAEEEIPHDIVEKIETIINELIEKLSTCLNDKKVIDKINNGISIAIIGEPNVGKSSLLNWLAKRDIAIVSPIAGTTRDVISVDLDIKGYKVVFYDTAGIRETNDLIEQEGVKRAKQIAQNANICIVMTDDVNNISELNKTYTGQDNVIFLLNKADLLTTEQEKDSIFSNFIKISVLKEQNLDILLEKIENKVCEQVDLKNSPMVINERHVNLLSQCIDALKRINFNNTPIEIIGEELRFASNCIGQITGEIYTDDILDNIFSKFCIGK